MLPAYSHAPSSLTPVITKFHLWNDETELCQDLFPSAFAYQHTRSMYLSHTRMHVRFETPLYVSSCLYGFWSFSDPPPIYLLIPFDVRSNVFLSNLHSRIPSSGLCTFCVYLFYSMHCIIYLTAHHSTWRSFSSRRNTTSLLYLFILVIF